MGAGSADFHVLRELLGIFCVRQTGARVHRKVPTLFP